MSAPVTIAVTVIAEVRYAALAFVKVRVIGVLGVGVSKACIYTSNSEYAHLMYCERKGTTPIEESYCGHETSFATSRCPSFSVEVVMPSC